ncbi:benzyl alcohol O-benzoyltransferase-like [Silene latifolia]|uniref:benzyl alcohol O-benzoyltransferase-like n=1 Tax=Silene latifolia TaxID=37657 RepID=UPI003D782238
MAEVTTVANTSLKFKVTREVPKLVPPARATPYEYKVLSAINEHEIHQLHTPVILVYGNDEHTGGVALRGKDPAKMVKEAMAKALVLYYPLAGRLRTHSEKKVVVECNGEGIIFIEADADVTLEEIGDPVCPTLLCLEELVPGSCGLFDCPLLLLQVTRLKCGGFILALRVNHVIMADARDLFQFMNVVAMLGRGAEYPLIKHVLPCHLRIARVPTCVNHKYGGTDIQLYHLVHKSFFFGPNEMATIRRCLPAHLRSASKFEVLTSYIWQNRTTALNLAANELVRLRFSANAIAYSNVITTAGELSANSLGYALELVKKANAGVTEEHIKSVADLLLVDVSWVEFNQFDFGWGLPVYGGNAENGYDTVSGFKSSYVAANNWLGENGIMVPICLPKLAMDTFVKELNGFFTKGSVHPVANAKSSAVISSSL